MYSLIEVSVEDWACEMRWHRTCVGDLGGWGGSGGLVER